MSLPHPDALFDLPDVPRVLLPLSLAEGQDEYAAPAVRSATRIVKQLGGTLRLVSALGPSGWLPIGEAPEEFHETIAGLRDQSVRAAWGRLNLYAEEVTKAGVESSTNVLRDPESVHHAIVDEVEKWDADLLLLPTHSRKGVRRILMGSVAERVAHLAPCSVLLLRIKGHDVS